MKDQIINIDVMKEKDIPSLIKAYFEFENFYKIIDNSTGHPYKKNRKNAKEIVEKEFNKTLRARNNKIFVAKKSEQIIGYLWVGIKKNEWIHKPDKTASIWYLYINKKFRGNKISSRLKDIAYKWLKERGIKYLSLDVHQNNPKASKIYKKWGFQDYEKTMWKELK